ncbi:MAG: hypothetical protein HRF40_15300 [Nitrososphaera sp.]
MYRKVHPDLQTAFRPKVIVEFLLSLLMIVTATGDIIAATRVDEQRLK